MKRLLIFLLLIPYSLRLCAQQHEIDSLYIAIKTEKEDTNKANTLNKLVWKVYDMADYNTADSLIHVTLGLCEKLGFKRDETPMYRVKGNIYAFHGNYDMAIKTELTALKIDQEINNIKGESSDYLNTGNAYYDKGDYAQAMTYITKSLDIGKKLDDDKIMSDSYADMAIIFKAQGNYPEALHSSLSSLKVAENRHDSDNMAINYGNIAGLYNEIGNYDTSLYFDQKALEIDKKRHDAEGIIFDYLNIGNAYTYKKNYPDAMESYLIVLKLAKEAGSPEMVGSVYGNIGYIYQHEKKYEDALDNSIKSLKIYEQIGNRLQMTQEYNQIGIIYFLQKNYSQARLYIDSSISLSKKIGRKESAQDSYYSSATLDSAIGDFGRSFTDYKNYITYRDSLKNDENTKKLVSEQMQYDFDKKQAADKAEQDKKDAIAAADKRKQKIITGAIALGLLFVLVFARLLFNRFKITQRQKAIIERQKALVEEKNKEMHDSITYAKRLQDAILPPLSAIKKQLPESFVLYKPKDIVAGDFYWMEQTESALFIAAADCTGHGVPGAMVSVVCSNALNRAVKEFKIRDTGKILDKVRELVLETFEKSESNVQDGMDISLVAVSRQSSVDSIEIQWSGAFNSLWYVENGEMKELAADKQPIGKTDNLKPFAIHNLKLQKGATLYLFTDGYADQFGGPKGKKFKYKALQQLLLNNAQLAMDEQKQVLERTFENWRGNLEQVDDVLIIGVRI